MDRHFRSDSLPPYVFSLVDKLKTQELNKGVDIIDFGMGNPDCATPEPIIQALIKAAQEPVNHRYSKSEGLYELRSALANWYQTKFAVNLDPQSQIIATTGAKEGLAHLALGICQPGDCVMVQAPCYPIHHYGFVLAGATIEQVPLQTPQRFIEQVQSRLEAGLRPKALVINFPHNPTTLCVDKSFFEQIIKLAKQYQFWVIHDFAYAEIAFDNYKPPSILSVEGASEVAVEVYSLSKTYNMPGWRVGFVSGNETLVSSLKRIKSYVDYGLFAPVQHAAIAALKSPPEMVAEINAVYKERRDALVSGLNKIGWPVASPRTTMFVWACIPFTPMDSLSFAKMLLTETGVVVSPGIGFGEHGDNHVRFALIEPTARIEEALTRIEPLLTQNHKERKLGAG